MTEAWLQGRQAREGGERLCNGWVGCMGRLGEAPSEGHQQQFHSELQRTKTSRGRLCGPAGSLPSNVAPLGRIHRPPCFTLTLCLGHWQTHSLPWTSLALSLASTGSQGQRSQEERGGECGPGLVRVPAEQAPHS